MNLARIRHGVLTLFAQNCMYAKKLLPIFCSIHRSSNIIVGLLTFKLLFQKNGPDWERISKMSIDILEKFQPKDFALEEIEDIICALGQAHNMFSRIFRMRIYEFFST